MAVNKAEQASLNVSGKLHRIYREKNGDVVVNHAGTKKQNGSYDKINLSDVAGVKSVKGGVKATTNWHKEHPHTDVKKFDSPVWDTPDPTKSEKHLSQKKENRARARARAAGRPYPNLIDNMAVSKGARLDKLASSRAGKRWLENAPLTHGEFYHGSRNPEAVKREGFSLKHQGRMNTHGPAVYVTTNYKEAHRYAHPPKSVWEKRFGKSPAQVEREKNAPKSGVLRVKFKSPMRAGDGFYDNAMNFKDSTIRQIKTPEANRLGFVGTKAETTYAVANPKDLKVVEHRYKPTGKLVTDTAIASGVAGVSAGYGAHKVKKFDTPAWTRSEGKNPTGGLNAKGRASAKAEGHNLKPPVKAGDNPRRKSFLSRMGNMPGPEHKPNGEPTRLLLSLNAWGASSKADAKKKAAAMSVGKSMVSPGVYKPARLLSAAERKSVKSGKNYADSQGAAAQARDIKNTAMRVYASQSGKEFGVKKPSLIRRAEIERGGYTKIKRNVYVKSSGNPEWLQSEAAKHAKMLPKMRRPTIVAATDKLPFGAGAAAANFGSKSSPRYILIPKSGVEPMLGQKRAMMHEAAHANTKRNFSRTARLKIDSKGKVSYNNKKSQMEEARADRYAAKNGGVPKMAYRTMAATSPMQRKEYIAHTYKLWGKDNPMADKAVKIGASSGLVGTGAYGVNNQIKKSYEVVSKVFPQRAILTQGTRKMRVMVHYEHSPTHWGIIHPTEGQRVAHKDSVRFIPNKKPKSPGPDLFGEPLRKSMEYSVVMNQSRFGGASAVGKSFELVEKEESWKNISHYQDKGAQGRSTRRNGKAVAGYGAAGLTAAYGLNVAQGDEPFRASMNHYQGTTRYANGKQASVGTKLKAVGRIARANPVAGLAAGSAVLAGTGAGMYAVGSAKNRHSQAKIAELRRKRGSIKKAEPMYDAQGNPVPDRKPLMSGNAKLGAAGTAIGLAGGQRMISAKTLPNRLQGQSDAIASKVKFNERLANDQIQRVQNASQIRNPLTRRKQVRMHQYYSDKAQSTLADSRAKQIAADNALKAAPAKKLAHLKSGAGLVATGGVMGGLAVYNNAKDRKNKAQVK